MSCEVQYKVMFLAFGLVPQEREPESERERGSGHVKFRKVTPLPDCFIIFTVHIKAEKNNYKTFSRIKTLETCIFIYLCCLSLQ